jgi:hypothetical protein
MRNYYYHMLDCSAIAHTQQHQMLRSRASTVLLLPALLLLVMLAVVLIKTGPRVVQSSTTYISRCKQ